MRSQLLWIFVSGLVVIMSSEGCKSNSGCTDPKAINYNAEAKTDNGSCTYETVDNYAAVKQEIKQNYAAIAFATYQDSYNSAIALKSAIDEFVANPSQAGFDACKKAWLDAREPYGQTEAFRFSNGPIDDEDGPEGLLNAWPMDESYVDYVNGDENAGIINDTEGFPSLSATILEGLNEVGGEENVAVGYHAIEFMLWGQDNPDVGTMKPGLRKYTDYLVSGGTAKNQARRGEYLSICADLLVVHLGSVVEAWDPNGGTYYQEFMAMDNDQALQQILTAIGTLSKAELAGERIFVALDNQDQEDEHSCFSDNTHRDIVLNARGIWNVYNGEYKRIDGRVVTGTSIADLLQETNPELYKEVELLSANSLQQTEAIPAPFDYYLTQETTGGDGPIMKAILTLQKQGDKFVEVGSALGLNISTDLPQ